MSAIQRRINKDAYVVIAGLGQVPYRHQPNKPDKGKMNGSCNRTACQRPGANWFNTSTRVYYCEPCARGITDFAKQRDGFHICFPSTGDGTQDATMKFGVDP
jgi:hypothetical protein